MYEPKKDAFARNVVGQWLCGRYRVEAVLGVGGMAVVFRGAHRNGNPVTIKMLLPELATNPDIAHRFLKEGYAANAVQHDGVVRVLDDDVAESGAAFVVMELLEGASLDDLRVAHGGRLDAGTTLALGYQLLDVLVAAHEKKIVHRDIKPANLFLTRKGELKVLDFGIARFRDGSTASTITRMAMGTPDYAAPEQMFGRQDLVDARADVYSTGATLFHLLTGEVPRGEVGVVRSVGDVRRDAHPALVSLIDRALRERRDDRWPDATTIRSAVLRVFELVENARVEPAQALDHMRRRVAKLPNIVRDRSSDLGRSDPLLPPAERTPGLGAEAPGKTRYAEPVLSSTPVPTEFAAPILVPAARGGTVALHSAHESRSEPGPSLQESVPERASTPHTERVTGTEIARPPIQPTGTLAATPVPHGVGTFGPVIAEPAPRRGKQRSHFRVVLVGVSLGVLGIGSLLLMLRPEPEPARGEGAPAVSSAAAPVPPSRSERPPVPDAGPRGIGVDTLPTASVMPSAPGSRTVVVPAASPKRPTPAGPSRPSRPDDPFSERVE